MVTSNYTGCTMNVCLQKEVDNLPEVISRIEMGLNRHGETIEITNSKIMAHHQKYQSHPFCLQITFNFIAEQLVFEETIAKEVKKTVQAVVDSVVVDIDY